MEALLSPEQYAFTKMLEDLSAGRLPRRDQSQSPTHGRGFRFQFYTDGADGPTWCLSDDELDNAVDNMPLLTAAKSLDKLDFSPDLLVAHNPAYPYFQVIVEAMSRRSSTIPRTTPATKVRSEREALKDLLDETMDDYEGKSQARILTAFGTDKILVPWQQTTQGTVKNHLDAMEPFIKDSILKHTEIQSLALMAEAYLQEDSKEIRAALGEVERLSEAARELRMDPESHPSKKDETKLWANIVEPEETIK